MNEEVKPAFTVKYVILTVVVSLLTGAVGFSLNYLFSKTTAENKSIKVATKSSGNLLAMKNELGDKIGYKFFLPTDPTKIINSYFQYTITVLNDGHLGIENFTLFVEVPYEIFIIKEPVIHTLPERIKPTISFTHIKH